MTESTRLMYEEDMNKMIFHETKKARQYRLIVDLGMFIIKVFLIICGLAPIAVFCGWVLSKIF